MFKSYPFSSRVILSLAVCESLVVTGMIHHRGLGANANFLTGKGAVGEEM